MRLIALLLVAIALPNVYMKYLLLEIDGDETPEVEPKSDKEAEDNADEPLIVSDLEKDDGSTGDIKTDNDNVDEDTGDYKCNYTIIFK